MSFASVTTKLYSAKHTSHKQFLFKEKVAINYYCKMAITKKFILTFAVVILIAFLLVNVSAQKFTGSIGNSRMVLKLALDESVRKSILVKNVNEVPITVNLTVSGDLAESIDLEETSFELAPGEEKKAYFTITATKEETTESKINVVFTPEGGNGVILSSNIIVIVSEESGTESEDDSSDTATASSNTVSNPIAILIISTLVLVAVFLALIIYSNKKKSKKRLKESRE